jgi:biotin synthase
VTLSESDIDKLGRKVLAGGELGREEGLLLADTGDADLVRLFSWANRIREANFGNEVTFCSIAAGKVGACSEDCNWCGQSARFQTHVARASQRTAATALVQGAEEASRNGAGCFCIVNAGRGPGEEDLEAFETAQVHIRAAGLAPACASLGEIDETTARRLLASGAHRYNHNLETSRRHFSRVVSTHSYENRLSTLKAARAAGLSLCCGGIFGIGETWEDRIDLALTLREEVKPEVVPLNFRHPIPGTPLDTTPPLSSLECLKIIALFRLLLPAANLKVAGGRVHNLRSLQSWIFSAGATSVMVGNYLTTCGREVQEDTQMVADLGLKLVPAFSKKRHVR